MPHQILQPMQMPRVHASWLFPPGWWMCLISDSSNLDPISYSQDEDQHLDVPQWSNNEIPVETELNVLASWLIEDLRLYFCQLRIWCFREVLVRSELTNGKIQVLETNMAPTWKIRPFAKCHFWHLNSTINELKNYLGLFKTLSPHVTKIKP